MAYKAKTQAGKKAVQFIEDTAGKIKSGSAPITKGIVTAGKNEAFANALQLVFEGKPRYFEMQDGKTHFVWEGEELRKAQNRVKQFAKPNPNSTTAVHYGDVLAPVIGRALIVPASLVALYLFAKRK